MRAAVRRASVARRLRVVQRALARVEPPPSGAIKLEGVDLGTLECRLIDRPNPSREASRRLVASRRVGTHHRANARRRASTCPPMMAISSHVSLNHRLHVRDDKPVSGTSAGSRTRRPFVPDENALLLIDRRRVSIGRLPASPRPCLNTRRSSSALPPTPGPRARAITDAPPSREPRDRGCSGARSRRSRAPPRAGHLRGALAWGPRGDGPLCWATRTRRPAARSRARRARRRRARRAPRRRRESGLSRAHLRAPTITARAHPRGRLRRARGRRRGPRRRGRRPANGRASTTTAWGSSAARAAGWPATSLVDSRPSSNLEIVNPPMMATPIRSAAPTSLCRDLQDCCRYRPWYDYDFTAHARAHAHAHRLPRRLARRLPRPPRTSPARYAPATHSPMCLRRSCTATRRLAFRRW